MQDGADRYTDLLEGHAFRFCPLAVVRFLGDGCGLQVIATGEEIVFQRVQLKLVLVAVDLGYRVEDAVDHLDSISHFAYPIPFHGY